MSRTVIYSLEVFVSFVVSSLALVDVIVSEDIVTFASAMAHFMPLFVHNLQSHFGSTSTV